jgi:transposase-like protein
VASAFYPVMFIGAVTVEVRDGVMAKQPVYLAIGIDATAPRTCAACGLAAHRRTSKACLTVR